MVAAYLLIAVLAGSISVVAGALAGQVGWISLALYTGGGLSGLALTAVFACCAALSARQPDIQMAQESPGAAETV
jgi:hypothetical protein